MYGADVGRIGLDCPPWAKEEELGAGFPAETYIYTGSLFFFFFFDLSSVGERLTARSSSSRQWIAPAYLRSLFPRARSLRNEGLQFNSIGLAS